MREVQVVAWCDSDSHEEREPATVERRLSVDGGRTILLDLCNECDARVIDPVIDLMALGAPADRERSPRSRRPSEEHDQLPLHQRTCPECGFVSRSRSALGQHLSSKHGKGFKDYYAEHPELRIAGSPTR